MNGLSYMQLLTPILQANYVGANHVLAVDKTWEEALATLSRVTQSRR